jgi:hypothetical protein
MLYEKKPSLNIDKEKRIINRNPFVCEAQDIALTHESSLNPHN